MAHQPAFGAGQNLPQAQQQFVDQLAFLQLRRIIDQLLQAIDLYEHRINSVLPESQTVQRLIVHELGTSQRHIEECREIINDRRLNNFEILRQELLTYVHEMELMQGTIRNFFQELQNADQSSLRARQQLAVPSNQLRAQLQGYIGQINAGTFLTAQIPLILNNLQNLLVIYEDIFRSIERLERPINDTRFRLNEMAGIRRNIDRSGVDIIKNNIFSRMDRNIFQRLLPALGILGLGAIVYKLTSYMCLDAVRENITILDTLLEYLKDDDLVKFKEFYDLNKNKLTLLTDLDKKMLEACSSSRFTKDMLIKFIIEFKVSLKKESKRTVFHRIGYGIKADVVRAQGCWDRVRTAIIQKLGKIFKVNK